MENKTLQKQGRLKLIFILPKSKLHSPYCFTKNLCSLHKHSKKENTICVLIHETCSQYVLSTNLATVPNVISKCYKMHCPPQPNTFQHNPQKWTKALRLHGELLPSQNNLVGLSKELQIPQRDNQHPPNPQSHSSSCEHPYSHKTTICSWQSWSDVRCRSK